MTEQNLSLAVLDKTPTETPQLTLPPTVTPSATMTPAVTPDATDPAEFVPDDLLLRILQTKRAHGSMGDTQFRAWLHGKLKDLGGTLEITKEGSFILVTDKKATTLFSCHIDTCHGKVESDGTFQKLLYDPAFGHIFLPTDSTSGCLGGDDGVGIYLMLKMIKAKVKGSYVFHVGEEVGGIGSRAIFASKRDWLGKFDRCVAFDRAVQTGESPEVIVTQGGTACASISFGNQLVAALDKFEFDDKWVVSHKGSFTDSKVYAPVISECVNLGCFYQSQHTKKEVVDAVGVEQLLSACLGIKWEDLKPSRAPAPEYKAPTYGSGRNFAGGSGFVDEDKDLYGGFGFPFPKDSKVKGSKTADKMAPKPILTTIKSSFQYLLDRPSREDIAEMLEENPEGMVDMMILLIAKYKGLKAESNAVEEMLGS